MLRWTLRVTQQVCNACMRFADAVRQLETALFGE